MNKFPVIAILFSLFAGCAAVTPPEPIELPSEETPIRPQARPAEGPAAAVVPTAGARTVEQFDTTTPQQRLEAASGTQTAERSLGVTVASLGSPTEPGFWMKTPLVSRETQGRVVYPDTGKSASVTLIPITGPKTAGSRLSLPALRLIGAPLTGLPEVQVYAES